MLENLFPMLGQLLTIGIVGALIGGAGATFAAQLAATHTALKKAPAGALRQARPRRSAPSRLSVSS